ncbi:MazG-like protein [Enterococcus hermanniensis]|uniref:30S ribosomal protein S15 n=1 Tax=Enterococcus hermanniensis TaxID=249189 RepID=A0A1L8TM86_9ENTE|nr:MazG-like protein [Enterococcus hermanniensis]OJG45416.1 30S ribosomal protein S15 [Enterococcus hermanniensis]
MDIKELAERSNGIRSRYHELEVKHHQSEWSIEEDLLALSNDIGNLNRLTMTKLARYYDETPYTLEQKLAENIWWLIELSNRLDIDIEAELEKFLTDKEKQLGL